MSVFSLNELGIHVTDKSFKVNYPETGNTDSLKFEEESFWFRHRNNVITKVLNKVLLKGNFVDIGGANGLQALFIQSQFPEIEVSLVEPGYYGCVTAKKRGLKNVYNCLFEDFDFRLFKTDTVGLFDVLEHIENDVAFLKQLAGKLQKGNKILLTVPAYNWLWSDQDDYSTHYKRYNLKMIHQLSKNTGLKIMYFSHFFSYLIPFTFLLRTIPYKIRGNRSEEEILIAANKEHKPSVLIDRFFSFLGSLEMYFIKKKSLKFGASIIVAFEVS